MAKAPPIGSLFNDLLNKEVKPESFAPVTDILNKAKKQEKIFKPQYRDLVDSHWRIRKELYDYLCKVSAKNNVTVTSALSMIISDYMGRYPISDHYLEKFENDKKAKEQQRAKINP